MSGSTPPERSPEPPPEGRIPPHGKRRCEGDGLDIRHVVFGDGEGFPSASNGVHQVARALSLEQARAGDAPRILFVSDDPDGFAAPPGIRFDPVALTGPRLRGRPLALGAASLAPLLAGAGPGTVFHLHGARRPLLIGLTRRLRALGLPYVITLHSCFSHLFDRRGRVRRPHAALYVSLFERAALQGARFVHVLTDLEQAELGRLAPRARARLVPNGAFSSAEAAPPPPRQGDGEGGPVFGFCGRLAVFHKGLDLLVDGFALHCHRGGTGRLVLMGPGPDGAGLAARAASLGLAGRVALIAPRYGAERDAVMRGWDFFAIPSRLDHWPTAALEAALLGVPMLVTRETGLHDYAERYGAGLLVADLSAEAVADALGAAERISRDGRAGMSEAAHRLARELADWTRAAERIRALYGAEPEPDSARPSALPGRALPLDGAATH